VIEYHHVIDTVIHPVLFNTFSNNLYVKVNESNMNINIQNTNIISYEA